MARKPRSEEVEEIDRVEGFLHPRQTLTLVGEDDALAIAARAIRSGRAPQGWLLSGPPGVGKATLAYRIARYVLSHGTTAEGPADLFVPGNDPVAAQVSAGSHPGLLVLKRGINEKTGKPMTVLSVDEIRKLGGFFGMTSGAGGWRVAIVDTADDMNDNAANALLKALEEPPPRAMLMLISNAPGRLLPTIRSRCQRLVLKPLAEDVLASEIARLLPDMAVGERGRLARLSGGSLGLALRLAGAEDGLALAEQADEMIENASSPNIPALFALGEKLARKTDGIESFGEFLVDALTTRIRARAMEASPHLSAWIEAREQIIRSFGRTAALNLEPKQTIVAAGRMLAHAARRNRLQVS